MSARINTVGLVSLCDNYSSGPECVAPTVLIIVNAAIPSPSGLGYVLPRLRRSGFVACAPLLRFSFDQWVKVGCNSQLLSGDLSLVDCDR